VTGDGEILRDTKRIWPLTEYIKAESVRLNTGTEKESGRASKALINALDFLFSHYLLPNGGWRERLTRDLVCYDDRMPATTPYHIYLALIEARRALSASVA
jgi:mannose-6-phosphate isomerase